MYIYCIFNGNFHISLPKAGALQAERIVGFAHTFWKTLCSLTGG